MRDGRSNDPRAPSPGPSLVLLAVTVAVCLLFLELGLRWSLGAAPAWRYPQEAYRADPVAAYALRPLQDAYTIDAPAHINSQGLRDAEFSDEPAPNVLRLLALGDSQTFGVGIRLEDTWPKQLERALDEAQPARHFEVLNAGLPASATWNHARRLPGLLDTYHPTCVVVGIYPNDVVWVRGTSPFGTEERPELSTQMIYLAKRSVLVNALLAVSRSYCRSQGEDAVRHEQAVLRDDAIPSVEEGWTQVQASLDAIRAHAAAHHACLVLLAMPRIDQVDGREPAVGYQRRLGVLADRLGIPLVDPLENLRQAKTEPLLVPWDGHYAGVAQRVMARALVPQVLAALSPRDPH